MNLQNWNASHFRIVLAGVVTGAGVAFGSAVVAYLQTVPASTLVQAVSNLASLKTFLISVGSAGLMGAIAFLAAYLKSFHVDVPGGPGTGVAPVTSKAANGVVVPPVPPMRNERRMLDMGRFLLRPSLAAAGLLLTGILLMFCTTAQLQKATTVTNASGQVCEIVVQATDPSLAPLCATAQAVANAILALGQQYAVTSSSDAGASDAGPAVGLSARVTNQALYDYLKKQGVKTVLDK